MSGVANFFRYQTYIPPFFFLCSVLPVCIFSVYVAIYFLFPLLQQKKYTRFIAGFIALIALNCITALFFYVIMRPFICPDCNPIGVLEKINITGNNGINIASFMALVALGIKFTKNWYRQEIQNRFLARQKITSELKLLKSRIQPDFLFYSLQALYDEIAANKNRAAEMLLKFSDLLSYTLYESNEDFVLIEKEMAVINEFVVLEKMMKKTNLSFIDKTGNSVNKKYIPSLILLSLIQNCVIALHESKSKKAEYTGITISTNNNTLRCEIIINAANADFSRNIYSTITTMFINRLETFYKNHYTLEFTEDRGSRFIIAMSLSLSDNYLLPMIEESLEKNYRYEVV